MNGRHVYTTSVSVSAMVRRYSIGLIACLILVRTSSLVTWSLYEMPSILAVAPHFHGLYSSLQLWCNNSQAYRKMGPHESYFGTERNALVVPNRLQPCQWCCLLFYYGEHLRLETFVTYNWAQVLEACGCLKLLSTYFNLRDQRTNCSKGVFCCCCFLLLLFFRFLFCFCFSLFCFVLFFPFSVLLKRKSHEANVQIWFRYGDDEIRVTWQGCARATLYTVTAVAGEKLPTGMAVLCQPQRDLTNTQYTL